MDQRRNKKIGVSHRPKEANLYKVSPVITAKIVSLQTIIKRTIIAAQRYKTMDVFGANELNVCVQSLEACFTTLSSLQCDNESELTESAIVAQLQNITNDLSGLFRTFGTELIDDLLSVCFGTDYASTKFDTPQLRARYAVMKEHVHPIGYKMMAWKADTQTQTDAPPLRKNRIVEDFMIVESGDNLDCFDLARTSKSFQTKVYGVKFSIQNPEKRRTLIVCGLVDDIMLQCLDFEFITHRIESLRASRPTEPDFESETFERFINSLTLKEVLVYDNSELYNRFMGYVNQVALIKQKTISQVTKEFIANELYGQRTTLIQLLLRADEHEYQYLAYLLYDLLSNDVNGNVDTLEQTLLFDSLPWEVKKYFRDAMKQTISYTNNLANFDNTKIPLEQQICLMKADDTIKEKAMQKLKEVKSKSDDSGSKARQYLEGLLRIPFGIYREEPILRVMFECTSAFGELVKTLNASPFPITSFPVKPNYTSMEMRKHIEVLKSEQTNALQTQLVEIVKTGLTDAKRENLVANICTVNNIIRKHGLKYKKLLHSGRKTSYMKESLSDFVDAMKDKSDFLVEIGIACGVYKDTQNFISLLTNGISDIEQKASQINQYMESVSKTLGDAVHGHDSAKRQVERIIGQWINGENPATALDSRALLELENISR